MWKKESESRKEGLPLQTYSSMPQIDRSKFAKFDKNKRDSQTNDEFENEITSITNQLFGKDGEMNSVDSINNNNNNINNNNNVENDCDSDCSNGLIWQMHVV